MAHAVTFTLRTLSLVAALAVAGAGAAQAQQSPAVVSASASVTGLTFQLIDLNPYDNETPWMSFTEMPSISSAVYGQGATLFQLMPEWSGESACCNTYPYTQYQVANATDDPITSTSLLAGGALTAASTDGTSSASAFASELGVAFTAQAALTEADILAYQEPVRSDVNTWDLEYGKAWRVETGAYSSSGGSGGHVPIDQKYDAETGTMTYTFNSSFLERASFFTVSAQTEVVITGVLTATTFVDPTQMGVLDPASTILAPMASAEIGLFAKRPLDGQTQWTSYEALASAVQVDRVLLQATLNPQLAIYELPSAATQDFVTRFRNTSDAQADVVMNVYASAGMVAAGGVGAIPEPSTWALMGLGLLGVAAARQRSERRA